MKGGPAREEFSARYKGRGCHSGVGARARSPQPAQRLEAGLCVALGVPFALGSRGAWDVCVKGRDQASVAWFPASWAPLW